VLDFIADRRTISIILIGLLAFGASATVAQITGIHHPRISDEFSYLLAADTFTHGRLTNPPHPMWVHFESAHIIQQPTYMSKYPPGQGLFLAAGQLLDHPIIGAWLSFALMCVAITWMLYAWLPSRWALLGGFLAIINPILGVTGYWAQSYWGGAVAATGGALVMGAIRRDALLRNGLLMGLGLALLANSRPYEGLVFSIPPVILLIKQRSPMFIPITAVLVVTAAMMGFYNYRVTSNALRMPYQVYEATYAVAPKFVWQGLYTEPAYRHKVMYELAHGKDLEMYRTQRTPLGFINKKAADLLLWLLCSLNVLLIPLILTRWRPDNWWSRLAAWTYGLSVLAILFEIPTGIHYLAPVFCLNYLFALQAMQSRSDNLRWILPLVVVMFGVLSYAYTNEDDLT